MKNFNFTSFKGLLNQKQLKKIIGGTDNSVTDNTEGEPKTKDGVIVPPRGN